MQADFLDYGRALIPSSSRPETDLMLNSTVQSIKDGFILAMESELF
jgi:hypothetical protein